VHVITNVYPPCARVEQLRNVFIRIYFEFHNTQLLEYIQGVCDVPPFCDFTINNAMDINTCALFKT